MATPRKVGSRWRVQLQVNGEKVSRYFDRKADATAWIHEAKSSPAKRQSTMTVAQLLTKYATEVSPKKPGEKWEVRRLAKISKSFLGELTLGELSPKHMARWRDERLEEVSSSTVLREINLLSSVFTTAVKEWELLESSPTAPIKKPTEPPPRDRLFTEKEIQMILLAAGDDYKTVSGLVGAAFEFALETGARIGEIAALRRADVDVKARVAHITGKTVGAGKTPAARRRVPLSPKAVAVLEKLPQNLDPVFGLKHNQHDAVFRKIVDRSGVEDATFHDTRHYACTHLSKKLDVLELAKSLGIKDLKTLLNVYYNPRAEDLAKKLA